jgi:hypothetical protein
LPHPAVNCGVITKPPDCTVRCAGCGINVLLKIAFCASALIATVPKTKANIAATANRLITLFHLSLKIICRRTF